MIATNRATIARKSLEARQSDRSAAERYDRLPLAALIEQRDQAQAVHDLLDSCGGNSRKTRRAVHDAGMAVLALNDAIARAEGHTIGIDFAAL